MPEEHVTSSWLGSIWTAITNSTNQLIAGAVIAGITGAGWLAWGQVKSFIVQTIAEDLQTNGTPKLNAAVRTAMQRHEDLVVQTVAAELARSQESNRLLKPLKDALHAIRSSEVGAMSVGSFTLTANSSYTLFLYFSDRHTGKLTLAVPDVSGSERYLTMQAPECEPEKIQDTKPTIKLEDYLSSKSEKCKRSVNIFEVPQQLRGLQSLTFALSGEATNPSSKKYDPNAKLDVTYVAYVLPAIELGK
jgi:hypothetical protein